MPLPLPLPLPLPTQQPPRIPHRLLEPLEQHRVVAARPLHRQDLARARAQLLVAREACAVRRRHVPAHVRREPGLELAAAEDLGGRGEAAGEAAQEAVGRARGGRERPRALADEDGGVRGQRLDGQRGVRQHVRRREARAAFGGRPRHVVGVAEARPRRRREDSHVPLEALQPFEVVGRGLVPGVVAEGGRG